MPCCIPCAAKRLTLHEKERDHFRHAFCLFPCLTNTPLMERALFEYGGIWADKTEREKEKRLSLQTDAQNDAIEKLQRALDLAAAQATRADVHVANGTANGHADALGIRQPNAIALAVGMADVVAAHGALLANLTNLSHDHTSFWCVNSHNTVILAPERRFDKCFFDFVLNKLKNGCQLDRHAQESGKTSAGFFPESL